MKMERKNPGEDYHNTSMNDSGSDLDLGSVMDDMIFPMDEFTMVPKSAVPLLKPEKTLDKRIPKKRGQLTKSTHPIEQSSFRRRPSSSIQSSHCSESSLTRSIACGSTDLDDDVFGVFMDSFEDFDLQDSQREGEKWRSKEKAKSMSSSSTNRTMDGF